AHRHGRDRPRPHRHLEATGGDRAERIAMNVGPRDVASDVPRSLRVCFWNRSYPPDAGATGQLLSELAEDLVRGGHEVWVVAGPPLPTSDGSHCTARAPRRERRAGLTGVMACGSPPPHPPFSARPSTHLPYF